MVHAIFCAHGQLAGAMLDSVCMVYGEVNVSAVAFVPGENAADIAICFGAALLCISLLARPQDWREKKTEETACKSRK